MKQYAAKELGYKYEIWVYDKKAIKLVTNNALNKVYNDSCPEHEL